jgi:uncharacterized membrane protein
MKRLSQYFLRGLVALLPIGLTIYLLYLFLAWSENLARQIIQPIFGSVYVPGMGLILGVAAVCAVGYAVSKDYLSKVMEFIELPFNNLPVVKSIYSSLKSFADYFSPHDKATPQQQVVVVRVPDQPLEIIGLVTRDSLWAMPDGVSRENRVAVYLPMSYMIGGYTFFVPRSWVQQIDMSVEEAMRSSLIAWMASKQALPPSSNSSAQGFEASKPGQPTDGS